MMDRETVIEVNHIEKNFKIFLDKGSTMKDKILFSKRRRYEERKVIKDISFSVKKGQAVGLIGHNGCGKSTTLKLLTKIMYPDNGSIDIKGRVSSLIELGAGFHPDMSGRENIYINASIFGLTKKEIDDRLEDIIAFSELEQFIDNPVRTYSSGMYMRLAFAVAINVDADILLIDEILAVGDANFQAKCFNKLREIKSAGVTIVLVTHDSGTVERFCDRAIWINDGIIQAEGDSREVVDYYLHFMNEEKLHQLEKEELRKRRKEEKAKKEIEEQQRKKEEEKLKKKNEDKETVKEPEESKTKEELLYEQAMDIRVKHFGLGTAILTDVKLLNSKRQETNTLRSDEDFYIKYSYNVKKIENELVFGMGIYTLEDVWIFGTNTMLSGVKIPITKSTGSIIFKCEKNNLLSGEYKLQVSITDVNGTPIDFYREYCKFNVINNHRDSGLVYMNNSWEI